MSKNNKDHRRSKGRNWRKKRLQPQQPSSSDLTQVSNITVLSWNLRGFKTADTQFKKTPEIVALIKKFKVQVICLQEGNIHYDTVGHFIFPHINGFRYIMMFWGKQLRMSKTISNIYLR